jgi:small-conductance mechanosensitive channel
MGFGDSSLDFELRVWIRQIRQRFDVTSDLNFAIDAAFRENGIEIPFPQRDLHLRSWSDGAQPPALRGKDD